MTDPTGRSFLSYRRTRLGEAELLIAAQHDLGIPTWQDIENLEEDPTERQLRDTLADSCTANGILWITPDLPESPTIRRVEIPGLLARLEARDVFFTVAVAAGGLSYEEAGAAARTLNIEDFSAWNLRKVDGDPVSAGEAATVAARVLKRRLRAIHAHFPSLSPLPAYFTTRDPAPFVVGRALAIDWSSRFAGRAAQPEIWRDVLMPALHTVADLVKTEAPSRTLVFSGYPTIPAALALGSAFLAPKGICLAWSQQMPDTTTQEWALSFEPEPSGFQARVDWQRVDAEDLALVVSVAEDASRAFAASRKHLPDFRGVILIGKPGQLPHVIPTPGQAVDLAHLIVREARRARIESHATGIFHLFIAAPVGLGILIGQLLNTLGPVQTYEHVPEDMVGLYRPAAAIHVGESR